MGCSGVIPCNKVFCTVGRFGHTKLSGLMSKQLGLHYTGCNCRCDSVVLTVFYICLYNNSRVRSVAAVLGGCLDATPSTEVPDSSAVTHKLGRLDTVDVTCADGTNGMCTRSPTVGLGSLVLSVTLLLNLVGGNRNVSISFSGRFVPTRGDSTLCSCGGGHNCFPNIVASNPLVVNVRGERNGSGIGFRRIRRLAHVLSGVRGRKLCIHVFHTSYNSFVGRLIRRLFLQARAFCLHTDDYTSHERVCRRYGG